MEKIDFVLPWVDGGDEEWQKEKDKYSENQNKESNSESRFRDMGTLKYVLRSIEKYCPWYNKIYLITEGHSPAWLNIEHDKIVLVSHDELYYDKSHLPVFSSTSIEMNLANIKGLSEKIVYLNDDMIIMQRLEEKRFFRDNKPVDFLSHGWISRGKIFEILRGRDSWIPSLNNNLNLINNKFSPLELNKSTLYHNSYGKKTKVSNFLLGSIYRKFLWIEHWHHPQPYLKSTFLDVFKEFKDEMMICSSNRFRANNDLTQYLYRYWQFATNNVHPYNHRDGYLPNMENPTRFKKDLAFVSKNNYNFLCFNDNIVNKEEFLEIKEIFEKFIEKKLYKKATFER